MYQTYFPVTMKAGNVRLVSATGFGSHYERPVYREDDVTLDKDEELLASAAFKEIFKPVSPIFGEYARISMTDADNKQFENIQNGWPGDPRLISNSYPRMLYFSVIVMTTVGFGDIVPISDMARLAVGLQAVAGVTLFGQFINSLAYRAGQGRSRVSLVKLSGTLEERD